MITTHPVIGGPQKQVVWKRFRQFHYAPETFLLSSECYLVKVEEYDGWIGFIAANQYQQRWGKGSAVYYSHKTAIKLPKDHPDYFLLWALVADHQAQMQVAKGRKFVCMAPADHSAYRDMPNSGWMPSTKDKRRQKAGYRSHRYVGAAMVAGA
jgi:hypothetical protein